MRYDHKVVVSKHQLFDSNKYVFMVFISGNNPRNISPQLDQMLKAWLSIFLKYSQSTYGILSSIKSVIALPQLIGLDILSLLEHLIVDNNANCIGIFVSAPASSLSVYNMHLTMGSSAR